MGVRDKEIDLLIEKAAGLELVEIKSAATAIAKYAKNINTFAKDSDNPIAAKVVVYDGPDGLKIAETIFSNWRRFVTAAQTKP
jgi:hypothetical protein